MTTNDNDAPLDVLAVGAHPDDAELFAGGTLAWLAERGLRVGLLHLTRGECGTRGTPEIRAEEAQNAANILGAASMEILDLGDGKIENHDANRRALVEALRRLRPRVVMTHDAEDRHPDHARAHRIVRDACFFANVGGYEAAGERHAVEEIVFFFGHDSHRAAAPDWIADVSSTFVTKLEALRAYGTQFHGGRTDAEAANTAISSPEFWNNIGVQAQRWGGLIGARYGEPFTLLRAAHPGHAFIRMFYEKI